eukprot:scaffold50_cov162-Ochromonas_danica.AAC.23
MGYALPSLIPRSYARFASAALFLYFGLTLLKDARETAPHGPSDELQEVEEELCYKKCEGSAQCSSASSTSIREDSSIKAICLALSQPKFDKSGAMGSHGAVFTQAFTLTFLAEWGDRSQLSTIALAASRHPAGVVLGGLLGHAFCTGLAVLGGRMLASRISERTVSLFGGSLFLLFFVAFCYWGPAEEG